jgi:CDP-diacylglycerol---glycerol-3-phosphate 3-phosphatidyltransferase
VYIFDDTLIISGANLSADYFENRQDRYVLVENCPDLADYYEQLVDTIADFSLRMDENQRFTVAPSFNSHPYEKDVADFVEKSHDKVQSFMEAAQVMFLAKIYHSDRLEAKIDTYKTEIEYFN